MQTISLANLSLLFVPACIVVFIYYRWTNNLKTPVYALARMVGQLCLIGFVLTYIFETENVFTILLILTVMLLASSWIALRSVPEQRTSLYAKALLATFLVNALLLLLTTQFVLNSAPWYKPQIVIPIAGMIFAVGMNSISIFSERFFSELKQQPDNEVRARNTAYNATLIPTINSLFAVGIVSLPGMMTGQILSGVSPLIAARYQIMIMVMLFTSSGLTSAMFYQLIKKNRKHSPFDSVK